MAEIVRLGKPATPTVVDLLWGRGAFQREARPYVALEVLGKLRDTSALPELRAYLDGPAHSLRVATLTVMLTLRHDAAARDEAVTWLNGWIRRDEPVDGLAGMLLLLPGNGWSQSEAFAFAGRLELDSPNQRGGTFVQLAGSVSPLSEAILKEFARRNPATRTVIVTAVAAAQKEHRASLAQWEKDTSPPALSQKLWGPGEWQEHRTRNMALLQELLRRDELLQTAL